ncbi:MAG: A/G-specific adenine glycosylase [Pyramidobacter porci]|uniref:A/G-specific adenine glycosylase n=1 Tax=Pyramidobacter porci TaxID=2605789 RepID=UPI002A751D5B|nr:A/G-specific adenine glycosylase [Pyramidobacter porci]MCI6259550.1 A/G-specific adenine glycosylase [Pyramidobacter sp.]MDY2649259.1 A/G-specific adenine glycosylase [Pyramidobacter porci]
MNAEKFHIEAAEALTVWYNSHKRDLPWRLDRDPYRILVSEAMLQQTQVERVKSFYARWMERFPTLTSLASASEDDVLACWQGLGYYSRARNLRKAARLVRNAGLTTLPPDWEFLRSLPGLGPYTVGAVCSIAFDLPVPAIDGNVRRVFSRLLDMPDDPAKAKGTALIAAHAAAILKLGSPHILTQAFMELGATVCTPGATCRCPQCPVSRLCAAKAAGTQGQRPAGPRKNVVERRNGAALLISLPQGCAVRKRPIGGLWSGFCEIPWLRGEEKESAFSCLSRLAAELRLSCPCTDLKLEETLKFTRWQVRLHLWSCRMPQPPAGCDELSTDKLIGLPMPAGLKRLVQKALEKSSEKQLELFSPVR